MKKLIAVAVLTTLAGFALGFFCGFRRGAVPPEPTAPSPEVVSKILAGIDENYDFSNFDPLTKKDATLQLWYAHQAMAASVLTSDTGHEFRPIWMFRSPITILEEQSDFMKAWLADLRKMRAHSEPEGAHGFPPETARDPVDGTRIDWEDRLEPEEKNADHLIWIGKNAKTGAWAAYEYNKGVYKPDERLLKRIFDHEKNLESADGSKPQITVPDYPDWRKPILEKIVFGAEAKSATDLLGKIDARTDPSWKGYIIFSCTALEDLPKRVLWIDAEAEFSNGYKREFKGISFNLLSKGTEYDMAKIPFETETPVTIKAVRVSSVTIK